MADESIRIPIQIDSSKGLAALVKFSRQASREIGSIGKGGGQGVINVPFVFDSKAALAGLRQLGSIGKKELSDLDRAFMSNLKTISQLEREMRALETAIENTTDPRELQRFNDQLGRLQTQVNNLRVVGFETNLNRLGMAGRNAASGLDRVPRSSNAASMSLLNLGRVAQDAPFGIIGIANNINPLLESFQRLKAESGKTSIAIKSLASSFMGAGGLGLAVSVVTGLMSFYALRSRSAKDETEAHKKEVDAAAEKQKEFKDAIDKAAGSVVNQADKLKDLRAQLLSTSTAIEDVTDATINQGLAALIFDQKNVELQKMLSAEIEKQVKLRKQNNMRANVPEYNNQLFSKDPLEKTIGQSKSALGMLNQLGNGLDGFFKKLLDRGTKTSDPFNDIISRAKEVASYLKDNTTFLVSYEFSPLDSRTEALKKAQDFLRDVSNGNLKLDPNIGLGVFAEPPTPQEMETALDAVQEGMKRGIIIPFRLEPDSGFINDDQIAMLDEFQRKFEEIGVQMYQLEGVDFLNVSRDKLEGLLQAKEEIQSMADLVADIVVPAFNNLFEAIMAGEDPLQAFFKSIMDSVNQLIKKLISAAIQALVISIITGGGGAAGGKSFGKAFGSAFGFAEGGLVFGPTVGLVGEGRGTNRNNPEVISPLDQLQNFFGGLMNDFVGRVSNMSGMSPAGASLNIPSVVMLRADGRDLVGTLTLVQQQQQRGG